MQKILKSYKTTKTLLTITEWTTPTLAVLFIFDLLYRVSEPAITFSLSIISLALYFTFKRHLKKLKKSLYDLLVSTDKIKIETNLIESYTLEDLEKLAENGETVDLATYTEKTLDEFTKKAYYDPKKLIKDYPNLEVLKIYETTSKLTIKTYGFNDILKDINEYELIHSHEFITKQEVKE